MLSGHGYGQAVVIFVGFCHLLITLSLTSHSSRGEHITYVAPLWTGVSFAFNFYLGILGPIVTGSLLSMLLFDLGAPNRQCLWKSWDSFLTIVAGALVSTNQFIATM